MQTANGTLWLAGGIAGVVSVTCYILAIALPWPEGRTGTLAVLALACTWPVLSIVHAYALYDYVAMERQGTANRRGVGTAIHNIGRNADYPQRCDLSVAAHRPGACRHQPPHRAVRDGARRPACPAGAARATFVKGTACDC